MTLCAASQSASRSVVALGPQEGEHIWFLDNLLTVKLRGQGAPYSLVEAVLPPGSATPFHRHDDEDEAFYVLEGELSVFFEGGRVVRGVPGSYVHVPRGTAHGFRTQTRLRMLVLSGAEGFVDFAREYGAPASRAELPPAAPPDLARMESIAKRHNLELLGPLPEADIRRAG
jgi:quercetin dioxygenase-like cupin family protein